MRVDGNIGGSIDGTGGADLAGISDQLAAAERVGYDGVWTRVRAHAGNQRLHAGWVNLNLRKKRPVIADVAIARELAGWCWSLAVLPD